jgi:ATP-dependent Clp protease ATP-binding subunit ClpC
MDYCGKLGLPEVDGIAVLPALMSLPNSAVYNVLKRLLSNSDKNAKAVAEACVIIVTEKAAKLNQPPVPTHLVMPSNKMRSVIRKAACEAQGLDHIEPDGSNLDISDPNKKVNPVHMFIGLMTDDEEVKALLSDKFGLTYSTLVREQALFCQHDTDERTPQDPLRDAAIEDELRKDKGFNPSNVPEPLAQSAGLYRDMAKGQASTSKTAKTPVKLPVVVPKSGKNPPQTSGRWKPEPKSNLGQFCVDMIAKSEAKNGKDPIIGREELVDRMFIVMGKKGKKNVALLGEPGVGKTAAVEALCDRVVAGDCPDEFRDCCVFALDMGACLAGTENRGQFEARIKGVLNEIIELNESRPAILFIDEIHTAMGSGGNRSDSMSNAAQLLKPALADGSLRCIGATTLKEYRLYVEKDGALKRRFQPLYAEEPSQEETVSILLHLRKHIQAHFKGVRISTEAVKMAAFVSVRYLRGDGFYNPDAAKDVLDTTCSRKRIMASMKLPPDAAPLADELAKVRVDLEQALIDENDAKITALEARQQEIAEQLKGFRRAQTAAATTDLVVTAADVIQTVSFWIKQPVSADDRKAVRDLNHLMKRELFGQDGPIDEVTAGVKALRAFPNDPDPKPLVYLLSGPTGGGKSFFAKLLARLLNLPLVRLDMSEYKEKHTVSTLIGAPPGYVGGDIEGTLSGPVHRHPYCVLLLDEIEKAHDDVFNLLLQVMDDGRLTDHQGRLIDFRNCIIICTTNIGAEHQDEPAYSGELTLDDAAPNDADDEADNEQLRDSVTAALHAKFSPEFLNRFTGKMVFRKLRQKEIESILRRMVDEERKVYETEQLTVEVDQSVYDLLGEFTRKNKVFNARPVYRAIKWLLRNKLADRLIEETVVAGDHLKATVATVPAGKRKKKSVVFEKIN